MKTVKDELTELLRRKYMESFYKADSLHSAPNDHEYERGRMSAFRDIAEELDIDTRELFEK